MASPTTGPPLELEEPEERGKEEGAVEEGTRTAPLNDDDDDDDVGPAMRNWGMWNTLEGPSDREAVGPRLTVSAGFSRVNKIDRWEFRQRRRTGVSSAVSYNTYNITRLLMNRERGGGPACRGTQGMPFTGGMSRHICLCQPAPRQERGRVRRSTSGGPQKGAHRNENQSSVLPPTAPSRPYSRADHLESYSLRTPLDDRVDSNRDPFCVPDVRGAGQLRGPDENLRFLCASCGTMQNCRRSYECYAEPCVADSVFDPNQRRRVQLSERSSAPRTNEAPSSSAEGSDKGKKLKGPLARFHFDPAIIRRYDCAATRMRHSRALVGHEAMISRLGLTARLHGHTGCVNAVYIDQETDIMVSGSDDTNIRMWDSATGMARGHAIMTGHAHNIFGVKTVPGSGASRCCTVAADGQVRLVDTLANKDALLDSQDDTIALGLAFVPQCSPVFLASFGDGMVRKYDYRLPTRSGGSDVFVSLKENSGPTDLCFSPREPNIVAIGCDDGFVRCYDIRMNASDVGCEILRPVAMYAPRQCLEESVRDHVTSLGRFRPSRYGGFILGDGVSGIDISTTGELLVTYRGANAYRFDMLSSQPFESSISLLPSSTVQFPIRNQTDNLIIDADTEYSGQDNVLTFLKEIKFVLGETCVAMGSGTLDEHVRNLITEFKRRRILPISKH